MAFRSISAAALSGAPPRTITAPAGVVDNDIVHIYVIADDSADFTCTGFTNISYSGGAGAGIPYFTVLRKVASSEPGTYSLAASFNTPFIAWAAAYSGRDTGTPERTPVTTADSGLLATPISASLNGITASTGDDIVALLSLATQGSNTWSGSTVSGYVERADDSIAFISGTINTLDNATAGATGALASTLTRSAGTNDARYRGVVIALPASGGGGGGTNYMGGCIYVTG